MHAYIHICAQMTKFNLDGQQLNFGNKSVKSEKLNQSKPKTPMVFMSLKTDEIANEFSR